MYEDLYWQNYDDMESNRIELAKQAKRDARLAAEAANKEEDLEMPIQLQQGSGFPGLASNRVRYSCCIDKPTGWHLSSHVCTSFLMCQLRQVLLMLASADATEMTVIQLCGCAVHRASTAYPFCYCFNGKVLFIMARYRAG